MEDKPQKFEFTFFSKEEIDQKFNSVLEQCASLDSYEEIIKTINDTFYNRMLLVMPLNEELSDFFVYRVSRVYEGFDPKLKSSFSYPPNPKRGRANLKDKPVFYCSFFQATALREMKEVLNTKETLYVSEWRVKLTKETFVHSILINSRTDDSTLITHQIMKNQLDIATKMVSGIPEAYSVGLKQLLIRIGDLFTLPGEENYKITSAYAHNALYELKEKGGVISMLMYPSVASNHNGINFAIHPDFVDSSLMELNKVLKLEATKVDKDGIKISVSEKGVLNNQGNVEWKKPTIRIKEIEYHNVQIWTHDKNTFKGEEALNMFINNSLRQVKDHIKDELSKVDLIEGLKQIPFTDDVFEFTFAERKHLLLIKLNHGCKVNTTNQSKSGCNCISHFQVPISWTEDFQ